MVRCRIVPSIGIGLEGIVMEPRESTCTCRGSRRFPKNLSVPCMFSNEICFDEIAHPFAFPCSKTSDPLVKPTITIIDLYKYYYYSCSLAMCLLKRPGHKE